MNNIKEGTGIEPQHKSANEAKINSLEMLCMSHSPDGELFNTICYVFSGDVLFFGDYRKKQAIDKRNKQITYDFWSGLTPKELASKYDLSLSMIYKITEKKL